METLIAFSAYYRTDDPRMSGKMDQFYTKALAAYNDIRYPELHTNVVTPAPPKIKAAAEIVLLTSLAV